MLDILLTVIQTLLSICFVLGSIALVHELGHYATAKLTGIWVIEFAIGFGNRLIKLKFGDTIYSLRPLPLGGFVRLAGMDAPEEEEPPPATGSEGAPDNSQIDSPAEEEAVDPDDLIKVDPDDPRGFPSKSRWVRTLVLSAGSIMNLAWAVVLFVIIYGVAGGPLSNIQVLDAMPGQPASLAGIRAGDLITAINGEPIEDWSEAIRTIQKHGGQAIVLDVARDNPVPKAGFGGGLLQDDYSYDHGTFAIHNREVLKITVVPAGAPGSGRIGIGLAPNNYDYRVLPLGRAIKKGWESALGIILQTMAGLAKIITRETQADVAGPVKIMQMIKEQSSKGIFELLYLTALLSVNIGLINLLPLPVLDGGRIVFVLLETVFAFLNFLTGWQLAITPKWEERIHFVGMMFLLVLLLLVTYQDIRNLF
ncbi:MAG: Membrane-associated zinc metalloprotease [Candidatus Ozemobacter sibiricus]|jgi:regulator of sigma E protease|uniref:Membrane-associated zinc metalloprotease n=1 Tax=Candidatus Ozemobacter sibiricus TaxID=2268124 RepID=A0A367ZST1_9BACT|nr:MAG: Membrane-associated zinc metalloprotease [Candidatus Ozemobacter sibiricus]